MTPSSYSSVLPAPVVSPRPAEQAAESEKSPKAKEHAVQNLSASDVHALAQSSHYQAGALLHRVA